MDKIIVLDFGGQYNQMIVRRIREMKIFSELYSCTDPVSTWMSPDVVGVILSGGPNSVYDEASLTSSKELFNLGIPVLGVCYGMQWIVNAMGGTVESAPVAEYGKTVVRVRGGELLEGVPETSVVWMNHKDQVTRLPDGFQTVASTDTCPHAAIENSAQKIYATQFHPEVAHTEYGKKVFENFAFNICNAKAQWDVGSLADTIVEKIREQVGDGNALCALSGGVDSSVAATLVHRAIGDRLSCIFVDHGLLRKNEADSVMETYSQIGLRVKKIDASQRFLSKLKGVTDPEQKRKIIGGEFIRVFEEEAKLAGHMDYLVQGTIYPDVIESGVGNAAVIKSHHNVGGLPDDIEFKGLIEPLNTMFKDEVRTLGLSLGIDPKMIYRQPFPGPGLAIRIMGEITEDKLRVVRESDAIFREEIAKAGLDRDIWQYFTVITPVKTVGVMGDARTYENVLALRAVTSVDAMTVECAQIPYDVLGVICTRIINEVPGVNRVVYDITSKPPGTIEWE